MGQNGVVVGSQSVRTRVALALGLGALSVVLAHPAASFTLPVVGAYVYMGATGLFLAGLLLGARWGLISAAVYLLALLVGFPPRAFAETGVALLTGPAGGYLLMETIAPVLIGLAVHRSVDPQPVSSVSPSRQLLAVLGVQFGTYVLGGLWAAVFHERDLVSELEFIASNAVGIAVPAILAFVAVTIVRARSEFTASAESQSAVPSREVTDTGRADSSDERTEAAAETATQPQSATSPDSRDEREQDTAPAPSGSVSAATDSDPSDTETATVAELDGPPQTIPSGPSLTVRYDDLTKGEPLGAGGNADVYRATVDENGQTVTLALKEPRMRGTLQTDVVEGIMSEAETWHKLDSHDHIVGVVDWDAAPVPWVALEYMDDGHLGERLGDIEFREALWIARCVTRAVLHAHRHGIVHLDLKPENVLFRSTDAWSVPKVGDWGLSKRLLEHSGTVEGLSPQYAAPEQFDESYGTPDNATDVYQLGALCYALFTGRPPHQGTPASVMNATLNDPVEPPSAIADVPERLDTVLSTALATDRDDRYDSAVYLRDEFDALWEQYDGGQ